MMGELGIGAGRAALAVGAALALTSCSASKIAATESDAKARWVEVEKAFLARAELVPDMTEIIANAPDKEREILSGVMDARAHALTAHVAPKDLDDAVAMDAYVQAQGQLTAGFQHLAASIDSDPDLESVINLGTLQVVQVQAAQARADEAVRAYDRAAKLYNVTITSFPNVVVSKVFYGATPLVIWTGIEPAPPLVSSD
jgi:LemA protein